MLGSPPPMRGKVVDVTTLTQEAGITPAYAGKSCDIYRLLHNVKDHPRLCGEKPAERGLLCLKLGSPPPMRGKVPRSVLETRQSRITPAYAGKSYTASQLP